MSSWVTPAAEPHWSHQYGSVEAQAGTSVVGYQAANGGVGEFQQWGVYGDQGGSGQAGTNQMQQGAYRNPQGAPGQAGWHGQDGPVSNSSSNLHYPPPPNHSNYQRPYDYPPLSSIQRAPPPPNPTSFDEQRYSSRFDPSSSSELPLPPPPQASLNLSATAQRFQTTPNVNMSRAPSPRLPPTAASHHPVPSSANQQNPYQARRQPSPGAVQQYQQRVDETTMLQHRISQVQATLRRGTIAETGPGSAQSISPQQRAHLDGQLRDYKNRELGLLSECESFTQQFGPVSLWSYAPSSSAMNGSNGQYPPRATTSAPPPSSLESQQPRSLQQTPYGTYGPPSYGQEYSTAAYGHPQQQYSQYQRNPPNETMHQPPPQQQRPPPNQHSTTPGWSTASAAPAHHVPQPHPTPPGQPVYPSHPPQNRFQGLPPNDPSSSYPNSVQQHSLQQQRQSPYIVTSTPLQQPPQPSYSHPPQPPHPPHPPPNSFYPHHPTEPPFSQPPPPTSAAPKSAGLPVPPRPNPTPPAPTPLPPGLQAQMDAFSRDQANRNGTSRTGTSTVNGGLPTGGTFNPLQALIKKAENGEMPVMTLSGLRKAGDVEREKEMERARLNGSNESERSRTSTNGSEKELLSEGEKEKLPTTVLAEMCRQGGGPSLAETVMTINPQHFWAQLQQTCAKRNISVFDEIQHGAFVVENKPIDLLQLFQTVVSRGGGYGKIDQGNAWPHVATLLSVSTRSSAGHNRLRDIYHRVLAPYENVWASQMIHEREKRKEMEEARRILSTTPASTLTSQPPRPSSNPPPHQQHVYPPGPPTYTSHPHPVENGPTVPPQVPSQINSSRNYPSSRPSPQGSSSMFATPISYTSMPPHANTYPSAVPISPVNRPSSNQPQPVPAQAQPVPTPEPAPTSSDFLEQARALRRTANETSKASTLLNGESSTSNAPQPPTTSPPQETSSTPKELPTPSLVTTKSVEPTVTASEAVRSAVLAAGQVAPFSKSPARIGNGLPEGIVKDGQRNVTGSKKRKNEDEANEGEGARTRTRSKSNLEAPVVGEQTNAPHYNPFEITHFLPFSTTAPSMPGSPSTASAHYSDPLGSAKSSALGGLRLDVTTSVSPETISPHSLGETTLSATSTAASEAPPKSNLSLTHVPLSPPPVVSSATNLDLGPTPSGFVDPTPFATTLDPSNLDSISLSLSLDAQNASRPGTSSWPNSDSLPLHHQHNQHNGSTTSFDPFGGLDGFEFARTDDGRGGGGGGLLFDESERRRFSEDKGSRDGEEGSIGNHLHHHSLLSTSNGWSADGLGGFDFDDEAFR